MLPAASAANTMPVLPSPGRYWTGAWSRAARATISPKMYDSVKRFEPTTRDSAASTPVDARAHSNATARRAQAGRTSKRLDELHHAPARGLVGESPGPRRHVVDEMLGLAGGRDDAGDRGMREDVLQRRTAPSSCNRSPLPRPAAACRARAKRGCLARTAGWRSPPRPAPPRAAGSSPPRHARRME